jgi:16S rRNA G966 N2-methylase RsmD
MNKFELHLMYKNETSQTHEDMESQAYMTKRSFDIILDSAEIDPRIVAMMPHNNTEQTTTLIFADPEYHKWLENKVIELLSK